NCVYAFMLGAKDGQAAMLRSFADQKVKSVTLLGCGAVPFRQEFGLLTVSLPEKLPLFCVNTLKIELE
ncbi:MAG: alpha-L-fucosidase, partial [Clostridiales bacterium]|nr:alpha-L-fucosidase [Clostridiales bacterium]